MPARHLKDQEDAISRWTVEKKDKRFRRFCRFFQGGRPTNLPYGPGWAARSSCPSSHKTAEQSKPSQTP